MQKNSSFPSLTACGFQEAGSTRDYLYDRHSVEDTTGVAWWVPDRGWMNLGSTPQINVAAPAW